MLYVTYSCVHDNTCTCIMLQYVHLLLIYYIYFNVMLILNYCKCLKPLNLGPKNILTSH